MRTKTLVLLAVLSAASIVTSVAQTVYSVNAVGYVNVDLVPGFNLCANPLVAENNTVASLCATLPKRTVVYKFDAATASYVPNTKNAITGNWSDTNMTLLPGEGAFIKNPDAAAVKLTFVGEVKQGTLTNALPAGFSLVSSMVPQEDTLDNLAFPKEKRDIVYKWDSATANYIAFTVNAITGAWTPNVPSVKVAEAFFVKKVAAKDWVRTFSVNQ